MRAPVRDLSRDLDIMTAPFPDRRSAPSEGFPGTVKSVGGRTVSKSRLAIFSELKLSRVGEIN